MNQYNVEMDAAGWPTGLSPESKKWIIAEVKKVLAIRPMVLWELVDFVRRDCRDEGAAPDFRAWALWDAIYCAVERAAREVADPRWTLKEGA